MDRRIFVSDITMKLSDDGIGNALSFRQKIELSKLLDRLGLSIIELGKIRNSKQDCLLVKSIASAVKNGTVCVPIDIFNLDSIELTWDALKEARHPRLQVSVPVSTVQMEYICHKKPAAIIQLVKDCIGRCKAFCQDVEFVAEDFSRSEGEFLFSVIQAAVECGATTISVHDTAGTLFDHEFFDITKRLRSMLPEDTRLGIWCSNEIFMADSCAIAAVRAGADEIKTTSYGNTTTSLKRFVRILNVKNDVCKALCSVPVTELQRVVAQIKSLCEADSASPFTSLESAAQDSDELRLTVHDDIDSVMKVAAKLGYELNEEDGQNVYSAFLSLASKNDCVEAKELDAIIACVAFLAPPTYQLEHYHVNSGNIITATCHLLLRKGNDILEEVCIGDGPIDAAFLAIEQLVGRKFELDDFQIQSVTQGSKSMGGAIVRLRNAGKVYSGRGISRDIVEASIYAYLSAVNKIVYEEAES